MEGAPFELNLSLRQKINEYLRKAYVEKNFSDVDYPSLLIDVQEMIIKSLQDYWMPKYFIHRLNRRQIAVQRWGNFSFFLFFLSNEQLFIIFFTLLGSVIISKKKTGAEHCIRKENNFTIILKSRIK